ncbi:hypothetical protein GTP46_08055 [Duganella sp. FT135W]|uniref:Uncharacterized protein n=1 Tax=Duganella flavida TaxID=2692175 RepID=A0A6L8K5E2_9BURK|nr:hypothetical protein [Duganella flavida]MYM22596.1 hypothetical protein [Duganella flavida]
MTKSRGINAPKHKWTPEQNAAVRGAVAHEKVGLVRQSRLRSIETDHQVFIQADFLPYKPWKQASHQSPAVMKSVSNKQMMATTWVIEFLRTRRYICILES